MVNRKSRNADFLQNGSPRKKILKQIVKKKIANNHPKEKPSVKKNKRGSFISWDFTKEYYNEKERDKKLKKYGKKNKTIVISIDDKTITKK